MQASELPINLFDAAVSSECEGIIKAFEATHEPLE